MFPVQSILVHRCPHLCKAPPSFLKKYFLNTVWAGGPFGLFVGFHKIHPIIQDPAFDFVLGVDSILVGMMTGPVLVPTATFYYALEAGRYLAKKNI